MISVNDVDHELIAGYFEGDMILSDKQLQAINTFNETTRKTRNVLLNADYRWPKKTVHYVISKEFSANETAIIRQSMLHISSRTCIRFQAVTVSSKTHHVLIRKSPKGCFSSVGYIGKGVQHVNLVPMSNNSMGCFRPGVVIHELLHTLGMFHQHSTFVRDLYVRIRFENIKKGQESHFRKLPISFANSLGVGYDYASIMHYGSYAFSKNGKPTIEALKEFKGKIGQRDGLGEKDVLKIKRMYKC